MKPPHVFTRFRSLPRCLLGLLGGRVVVVRASRDMGKRYETQQPMSKINGRSLPGVSRHTTVRGAPRLVFSVTSKLDDFTQIDSHLAESPCTYYRHHRRSNSRKRSESERTNLGRNLGLPKETESSPYDIYIFSETIERALEFPPFQNPSPTGRGHHTKGVPTRSGKLYAKNK